MNQAFDPVANVAYAASYLKALNIEQGSWAKAVAHYHSADPGRYRQYRMKVHVAWRQERAKFLAAMSEVQAAQYANLDPLPTIMTWHQATVAEPFHNQLATLTFASAEFDDGTENELAETVTMAALAYQPALPVSIDALEAPSEFGVSAALSARVPAGPTKMKRGRSDDGG